MNIFLAYIISYIPFIAILYMNSNSYTTQTKYGLDIQKISISNVLQSGAIAYIISYCIFVILLYLPILPNK
jgi:hypothetical protein